ncbi:MAG: DUF2344 domain-containing protein [Clostridia bacterium]|nr:DUF2344 domain-containing protein [Clostridia bacterium]
MLSEPAKIRVEFSKTGALKFISHLDLNRTVQNAFLRSKLPIWYTQGFNPHPKTVFSPPLSVGVSSECEFMDFRMNEIVPAEEIVQRLNASFPEGLRAIAAYEPQSSFSQIAWAEYEIGFECKEDISAKIKALLSGPLEVEKTGKAGTKTVDISPGTELLDCGYDDGIAHLRVLLSCGELTFVGPYLLTGCISDRIEELDGAECFVHRKAVLLADKKTHFR